METVQNFFWGSVAALLIAISIFAPDRTEAKVNDSSNEVVQVAPPISEIFVPRGFDNNDNAQVIVFGAFPNSCYKAGHTRVSVDEKIKRIRVSISAYYMPHRYCLMVYLPFTEVISVGVLSASDYQVEVNKKMDDYLPVAEASTNIQDTLSYATIIGMTRQNKRSFELQGVLPSACAQLKEIRVILEAGHVIVVLPIVDYVKGCEPKDPPKASFLKRFEVPDHLEGKYLVHVRSANGASVNQVVGF